MTDQDNENTSGRVRFIIEFEGPDSCNFSTTAEGNPTPLQVFLAAHFIAQQAEARIKRAMVGPSPQAPPTLVPIDQFPIDVSQLSQPHPWPGRRP